MILTKEQVHYEKIRLVESVARGVNLPDREWMTADEMLGQLESHYPALHSALRERFAAMDTYYGRLREADTQGGSLLGSEERVSLWTLLENTRVRLKEAYEKVAREDIAF